jgi:hypothetical protein
MPSKRETAWELDEDRVAGSADGSYLGGIPGLWFPGEAIHPEALGFGVEEFRELVRDLDLPLREVKVGEGKAARSFRRAADDQTPRLVPGRRPPGRRRRRSGRRRLRRDRRAGRTDNRRRRPDGRAPRTTRRGGRKLDGDDPVLRTDRDRGDAAPAGRVPRQPVPGLVGRPLHADPLVPGDARPAASRPLRRAPRDRGLAAATRRRLPAGRRYLRPRLRQRPPLAPDARRIPGDRHRGPRDRRRLDGHDDRRPDRRLVHGRRHPVRRDARHDRPDPLQRDRRPGTGRDRGRRPVLRRGVRDGRPAPGRGRRHALRLRLG